MYWPLFAFLIALFESIKDILSKKTLQKLDEYAVAWALRVFAFPFLLPLLLFFDMPVLGDWFWLALLCGGSLNLLTTILYMRAIKYSDLSLTIPMITFTPLFLLLTSPLIVGEFPDLSGIVGILLIVIGSYILNLNQATRGQSFIAPIKALWRNEGPRLMLLVAFIWSITSNIDKVGIRNSSVPFWAFSINAFLALGMVLMMLLKARKTPASMPGIRSHLGALSLIGFVNAGKILFQMVAINLTLVAYVISIKRTSALITVVLGYLIFKEKGFKERVTGVIIMLCGVFLITLF